MRSEVADKLDTTLSYKYQEKERIQEICAKVSGHHTKARRFNERSFPDESAERQMASSR